MAQRNTSDTWMGPTTREMVATHTLAKEIMARHNDPCPVLDDSEILILRSFVQNPAQAGHLLQEHGMLDASSDAAGTAAQAKGSLAGYIAATYGTGQSALNDDEVDALKEWFASGGGRTNAEL